MNELNKASIQLNDSVSIISEVINDLSDISRSMSSEILLNNGFINGLEFEVAQLNKSRMYRIKLQVTGEPVFLDSQRELVLFRIVQESLNNIVKHAAAACISIHLHFHSRVLTLKIIDDGKGFEKELYTNHGTGLANMKRRAGFLEGRLNIESKPGKGTVINIEIPLYETEQNL
jgi:signal transduction histidine kinase